MMKSEDLDIVARTLYGEARGEPREGKVAVAWVIKNRVDNPRWWGSDWRSVCLKPWQFSCWNAGDPNYCKVKTVTTEYPAFRECLSAAASVMSGEVPDPTGGANHYFAKSMMVGPDWGGTVTAEIGRHIFVKA